MRQSITCFVKITIQDWGQRQYEDRNLDVYLYDGKTDLKVHCLPSENQIADLDYVKEFQHWVDGQSSDDETRVIAE